MRVRRLGVAGVVVATLLICIATLTPTPGTVTTTHPLCIACGDYGMVDLLANIVLFVPLGFALRITGARLSVAVLCSIALTLFVEIMQLRVVAGRDASISDLLANTLGGLLGAVLARRATLIFTPSAHAAVRLALGWCVVTTGVLAATSWGLSAPEVPYWLWVQWEPRRAPFEPFAGELVSFDVGGESLRSGLVPPSARLHERLQSDEWNASALVTLDSPPAGRSVIVRIAAPAAIMLSVEQVNADLYCRVRTRAAQYRLRPPRAALREAFTVGGNGVPNAFRLTCGRRRSELVAKREYAGGGARDGYALPLSPSLGWALLSPFELSLDGRHEKFGAAWLFALTVPFGFWLGAAGRGGPADDAGGEPDPAGGRVMVACVGVLLVALAVGGVVTPLAFGTAVAAWWEWGAALAGAAAGVTIAVLAARVSRRRPLP